MSRPSLSPPTAGIREKYQAFIDPAFSVSLSGKFLSYVHKDDCRRVNLSTPFFVHVTPVDETDLPEDRARYGFDNRDFTAPSLLQGGWNTCTFKIRLPDYAIRHIHTGQYVKEVKDGVESYVHLWETHIDPSRFGQD